MRTRWGLIVLLFCCGLMAAFQFIKVSLVLVELALFYGRSLPQVSFLVSLVSVMGVFLGVVAGGLVARFGTRRMILLALCVAGVLSLVQSVMPPFWIMVGLRFLEGASHLGLVVAIPPVMAAVARPVDQPVAMALWAAFFGMAFGIASVVFPPVLAFGGVSMIFGLHGVGLLLLAVCLAPLIPPSAGEARVLHVWSMHREIYQSATLRGPALVFVFYTLMFLAAVTFLPGALGQPALTGILPLVSLLGNLCVGVLGRVLTAGRLMVLGYLCCILGALGVLAGLVWPSFLLFLGMGIVPGASFGAIARWNDSEADRALATGAMAQMGNIGTGLGTPVLAAILTGFGDLGVIWALLVMSCFGILVTFWVRKSVRRVLQKG